MTTTIVTTGKIGAMVSESCENLADTEFVSVSDSTEKLALTDSELVITVVSGTPAESEKLYGSVACALSAESIMPELVIPPFKSGCKPGDYTTAGRNIFFLPQQGSFSDETDYYEHCVSEAADCIKQLKRVVDSMNLDDNFISIDKADLINLLYFREIENCKYVIHVEGSLDECIGSLKTNRLICPETEALLIMGFLPKTASAVDWQRMGEIIPQGGNILSGIAFVDDTDKYEFIILGVNRI